MCEVKSRKYDLYGSALEQVNLDKIKRLKEAASIYISEKNLGNAVRFDIITFDMQKSQRYILRHHKNAF